MTYNDFIRLSNEDLYEFRFYYGEKKYGILAEDHRAEKIYLVPSYKINELNQPGRKPSDVGELVNIAGIVGWKILDRNQRDRQVPSFPMNNPPVIRKLIIIGAGASYDCGIKDERQRPPLANELFQDRCIGPGSYYQGAYQLCADLAHTNDIEAYFQNKWDRIVSYFDPNALSKIINVQFYLHDLFVGISKNCVNPKQSNYKSLVNLVDDYSVRTGEHVAFVNFNYDLLLEDALNKCVKYNFNDIDDYVDYQSRKLLLFKPHGSCNFIRKLDASIAEILPPHFEMRSVSTLAEFLYKENRDLDYILGKLNGEIELLGKDEIIRNTDTPELVTYLPQLLIPYKAKDSFVMPAKHEIWMEHFLSGIDEIIVIGWKGTEAKFQHLLKRRLHNKKVTITTITGSDDSARKEFSQSIPNAVYKETPSTFSDFIKQSISENKFIFDQG
jgi:hypothetical protein